MRVNSKKCRICLIDNPEDFVSLKDNCTKEHKNYWDLYEYVTGFKIDETGPQKLCRQCTDDLLAALEFKKRCEKSEEILNGSIQIKTEYLEEEDEYFEEIETKADPESILFVTSENWEEQAIEKPTTTQRHMKNEQSIGSDDDGEACESDYVQNEEDSETETSQDDEEEREKREKQKQKRLKTVTCPYCVHSKIYKDKDNLRKHCRKVHQDQKLKCPDCNETFFLSYQLKRHRRTAHEKKSYSRSKSSYDPSKQEKSICCHCGKIMAAHYMDRHINDVHLKAHVQYTCDICKTIMHTKGGLISHMRRKHMDVKYECSYCKESFPSYGIRRTHELRFHTFAYKFECNLCGHKFISNRDLRKHRVTHTGEKNFRCEICGIQVSRKSVLNLHMAVHSDARPFSCEICQASFKTKKALKVHYGVHSERNYECPVCNQKFLVNQAMRLHAQKRHPDYILPPPGTVMNKSALARIQEINAKYNVNYKTTPRIHPKLEPGTILDPATGLITGNVSLKSETVVNQHNINEQKTEIHSQYPPEMQNNIYRPRSLEEQHNNVMLEAMQVQQAIMQQPMMSHHIGHNAVASMMHSPLSQVTSPGGSSIGGGQ